VPPKIAVESSALITTQAPRLSASVNPRATAGGFFSARVRSIALPARNRSPLAIEVLIQALRTHGWPPRACALRASSGLEIRGIRVIRGLVIRGIRVIRGLVIRGIRVIRGLVIREVRVIRGLLNP
jgi:hypothetical protein